MSPKKNKSKSNGGKRDHVGNIAISGDVAGRNMVGESTTDAPPPGVSSKLAEIFLEINQRIDQRPDSQEFDKDELKDILKHIEREIQKGDAANPAKLERWLGFLSLLAPDLFDLTGTLLLDPIFRLPRFVETIIRRTKENK